jgi:dTDP-4-dehydrorhamnose 3,5-epimerase
MSMQISAEAMPGIEIFTANCFPDDRGNLVQSWVGSDLDAAGIPSRFHQAIQTMSKRGVVRGLHFQWDPPMGKLVRCIHGAIVDVVVDVRVGSPTQGKHVAVELAGANHKVIWVPPGFAHGTVALEEGSIVLYECTSAHSSNEGGIRWDDPALEISWPTIPAIVSEKDRMAPTLAEWLADPRAKSFSYR